MKKQNILFLSLVIFGISLVGIGVTIKEKTVSQIFVSIGAGILGASLSNLFSVLNGSNALNIISKSITNDISSKEEVISSYRKVFYAYWITENNGSKIWRCCKYDFRKEITLGKLSSKVIVHAPNNTKFEYNVTGAIRKDKLIIFQTPSIGNEPIIVSVFPNFTLQHQNINYGLAIFQTYDKAEVCSPEILSEKPINGKFINGPVNKDTSKILNELWIKNKVRMIASF